MTHKLMFLFVVFATAHIALADENQLLGVWVDNKAEIDTIAITEDQLSWDHNPKFPAPCNTTYTLVSKTAGDTYPDNAFSVTPGRTFTVYKIELAPKKCLGGIKYLQFAIPSDSNGRYADVNYYVEDGRYVAYVNYSKRK